MAIKYKITKDQTFSAIVKWFNSSEKPEHIEVCEEAAVALLKERFGADKECTIILDAAEQKKQTPTFKLIV